jgi:dTDP-D-glucose 4,6-dehydratase
MNYNFEKLVTYSTAKPKRDHSYILSNKKIKKDFLWRDKISTDEGITRCINWVENNLSLFSKQDQSYQHKK